VLREATDLERRLRHGIQGFVTTMMMQFGECFTICWTTAFTRRNWPSVNRRGSFPACEETRGDHHHVASAVAE